MYRDVKSISRLLSTNGSFQPSSQLTKVGRWPTSRRPYANGACDISGCGNVIFVFARTSSDPKNPRLGHLARVRCRRLRLARSFMSNPSLAERARKNRKSRSPVQDTVRGMFEDVVDAIAAGVPYRTLHEQLTREGHNVGKSHGSLFAAVKAVRAERAIVSGEPVGQPSTPPVAASTTSSSVSVVSISMPDVVIDSRRKMTDWGAGHDD